MYIKLGTTNIKYLTSQNDFIIISEVVDSKLSYERPVLVRTSDELDVWFGRSFSDRDYLAELLETGVTLFLYKPIQEEINNKGDNYIDYYIYSEDPKLYYNEYEFPETGEDQIKYKLVSTTGKEIDSETSLRFDYWIWLNSEYINTSQLPQNLDLNNTNSLNNREVLSINYNGYKGPEYTYPDYQENFYYKTASHSDFQIDTETLLSNLPDLSRVNEGYETLCYDLKFTEDIDFGINKSESPYIILSTIYSNGSVLVYFNSGKGIPASISTRYYNSSIEISTIDKTRENIIEEFLKILNDFGFLTDKISEVDYLIYTSFKTTVNYFYNIDGFSMIPNFNRTYDILSDISEGNRRIEFTSKTIGIDDDSLIKVNIEKLATDGNYRITISRFDYSEIFEGSIFDGSNRIDYKINNDSILVRCNLIESYINSEGKTIKYKLDYDPETERDSSLPIGEWELRRGEKEEYNPKMYWKSIESIFNDGDTVFFDYFLVSNIKDYTNGLDPNYDYYKEYEDFLDYSKLIDCQVLIQNSDSNWTFETVENLPTNPKENIVYQVIQEEGGSKFYIVNEKGQLEETVDREIINTYGNDYVFNYTEDMENRLIYFYRPMTVLGNNRPAYYVYLDGLFRDTYSASVKDILYNSPVKNPYETEDIEVRLEKYKSNYLVDNNQIYYYKRYQNGLKFYTTAWMRFCMGKVGRELEKNKGKYLSERMSGNMKNTIIEILNKISNTFSIIRRISLTKFKIKYQENKIELTIEIYMSDLVNNNISLDVTLNYNK